MSNLLAPNIYSTTYIKRRYGSMMKPYGDIKDKT